MMAFLRFLTWSLITAGVVVAVLGGAGYWLYREAEGPGPLTEPRTLIVPPHTGISGIADLLADEGVIRHGLVFELIAGLSARGGALKAGEYEFPAGVSVLQALEIIAGGKTVKHRLTIPEGLTSVEVMALLRDAPALDGDTGPTPSEGELLPDTYVYSYGETRKELVERMRKAMAHALAELWQKKKPDLPLASPQEAVTLASVVEKETAREEERAHVAGVFINRLRLGMKLQSDPTVLFSLGGNGAARVERPLTHADLAVNSPYNTYLIKGLPPGPIANPGRTALRAAVRPERTEDLFFVADGTGGHVFAKTLADQSRNIGLRHHGGAAGVDTDPAAPAAPGAAPNAAPPNGLPTAPPAAEPPRPAKPAPAAARPAKPAPASATRATNPAPAAVVLRPAKPRQPTDKDRRPRPIADQPTTR
jgi:UPF0755 protein